MFSKQFTYFTTVSDTSFNWHSSHHQCINDERGEDQKFTHFFWKKSLLSFEETQLLNKQSTLNAGTFIQSKNVGNFLVGWNKIQKKLDGKKTYVYICTISEQLSLSSRFALFCNYNMKMISQLKWKIIWLILG